MANKAEDTSATSARFRLFDAATVSQYRLRSLIAGVFYTPNFGN